MSNEQRFLEILPGLDCGLCNAAGGCRGYALQLERGDPDLSRCRPGGESLKAKLAELLAELGTSVPTAVAALNCQGSAKDSGDRYEYRGIQTCRAAMLLYGGPRQCLFGCLRMGDCQKACPYGAITWDRDGLPKIIFSKCQGCGSCVRACPKDIIALVPKSQQVYLACFCQAKAEGLEGSCSRGCTSCALCLEACPYGAITWDRALPRIDYQKCRSCSICVYKCPPKSYIDRIPVRPTAFIGLQCNGCEHCKAVCPTDCITGKKGEHHKVIRGQCLGCGQCFEVCPFKAVTMLGALGHVDLTGF